MRAALGGKGLGQLSRRLRQECRLGCVSGTVAAVADERMADRRHVDPDLVRAAGFQPAIEERGHRRLPACP